MEALAFIEVRKKLSSSLLDCKNFFFFLQRFYFLCDKMEFSLYFGKLFHERAFDETPGHSFPFLIYLLTLPGITKSVSRGQLY